MFVYRCTAPPKKIGHHHRLCLDVVVFLLEFLGQPAKLEGTYQPKPAWQFMSFQQGGLNEARQCYILKV